MFKSLTGYTMLNLRDAVSSGDLTTVRVCLAYFQKKGTLNKILHSVCDALVRDLPHHNIVSTPIFEAFRNNYKPQFSIAIILLEAGTNPCFSDWMGCNILHFAIGQNNFALFKLLLWYVHDFDEMYQVENAYTHTKIYSRIDMWEKVRPRVKAKVEETVDDVKLVRDLLAKAKSMNLTEKAPLIIEAASLYLKHADYELLPENTGHAELRKYYLQKAYEIYQELDEHYHCLPALTVPQQQQHIEISKQLSKICKALALDEESICYTAYANILTFDLVKAQNNSITKAQVPFLGTQADKDKAGAGQIIPETTCGL